ncbi:TraR/DksA family transcriptional regulator [Kluyvera ascorbata]|uniref:TraR/DksA family transcriptional regulator n=1 Tax=Kluyvera ascorbata TaxID=51288 RepID=UPI0020548C81|nr:TraR/DksA family transcriptional regulator [Kluyvera ascorbata]UPQ70579.1 TraR/DksA family transcriptional regulator [Kluyvera ascorbata]
MADIIDSASEVEELQRNAALAAHRINRLAVSALKCSDCGDPLTEERREASPGCTMCVSCQDDSERRNRRM